MYISSTINPVYAPAMRQILSITSAYPAVVVTTFDGMTPAPNGYIVGLIVRLYIPLYCGMEQIMPMDYGVSILSIIDPNTFSINLDTTNISPFIPFIPPTAPLTEGQESQPPQVVVIGEVNDILTGAVQNILPPAFRI
jgi:hypothetical protein